MWFDHVPVAVADLEEASQRFRDVYGLGWSGEGRHPQGTRVRAIPLDATSYLELLECTDDSRQYGRDVSRALAAGLPLMGLGIEVDDIDGVAQRLGIPVTAGTVEFEDGTTGHWGTVGGDDDSLPFFVRYARSHAERAAANRDRYDAAGHTCTPSGIAWVEWAGDEREIREWPGESRLDVRVVAGPLGISRVAIRAANGEIVLGQDL